MSEFTEHQNTQILPKMKDKIDTAIVKVAACDRVSNLVSLQKTG